jgi:pimeloyl-ACP methyl ester carboxylesterase
VVASVGPYHPFRSLEARERYLARYDERATAWPVPSETRMVPTETGETLVRISGSAGAPAVMLLPGKWSDSLMWSPEMIGALSERYRVCAVDNPYDIGRSVSSRGAGLATDYAVWMDGLLGALDIDDVRFVGLSLGAWVAAEYALHAPDRVAKMAWISPGGVLESPGSIRTMRGIPLFFAVTRSASPKSVDRLMRWLMPLAANGGERVRREYEAYVDEVAFGLQAFAPLPAPLETNRRFSDAELRRLDMPLLYIAGDLDKFVSASSAVTRLAKLVPHSETMVFDGIGHELEFIERDAVTRRVLEFLDA